MKFKEYSFKSLLKEIIDNRGKTCPTDDVGIPLIATNCIKNDALYPVHEKVRYVNQATYESWFRGHPLPGDMIFVCKGSPGRVCWVPDPVNFCIAQDMVAIRADDTKVYPKYLFALLRSEETQQKILNMHVGTLIPHFKKGDFGNLYFNIPQDMEYQKIVGDAYFEFCKKIELNIQTNHTLESIAQAIFKSWFVDFEPIKAKIAAKERWYAMQPTSEPASPVCYADEAALPDLETYTNLAAMCAISGKNETELAQLQQQNPDHYQQLAETAALFPSAMVDSELGEVPEGWEVCKFQEIASIIMGQSPSGDTYNSEANGIPLINGPVEFGDYYPERTKWTTSPTKLATKGDLVVCVRGSTTGRFVKSDGQYCLGRGVCAIRGKRYQCFVDLLFKYNIEALLQFTTGSTFPNWSSQTLTSFSVTRPTDPLIIVFEEQINALTTKLENGVVESHYLSQLRDSLLPKLLSGEIYLTEIQSEVA